MGGAAGWTTGSSSGCSGARITRTSTARITVTGWPPGVAWSNGSRTTTRNGPIRPWLDYATPVPWHSCGGARRRSAHLGGDAAHAPVPTPPRGGHVLSGPSEWRPRRLLNRLAFRAPITVRIFTESKQEGRGTGCTARRLLFPKSFQSQSDGQRTTTQSASTNRNLFSALGGLENGIHLFRIAHGEIYAGFRRPMETNAM